VLQELMTWIDQRPVWAVVATSFVVGSLLGVVLRLARRGKWEEKERREAEKEAARAAKDHASGAPPVASSGA
jgi:hypothetical protein